VAVLVSRRGPALLSGSEISAASVTTNLEEFASGAVLETGCHGTTGLISRRTSRVVRVSEDLGHELTAQRLGRGATWTPSHPKREARKNRGPHRGHADGGALVWSMKGVAPVVSKIRPGLGAGQGLREAFSSPTGLISTCSRSPTGSTRSASTCTTRTSAGSMSAADAGERLQSRFRGRFRGSEAQLGVASIEAVPGFEGISG